MSIFVKPKLKALKECLGKKDWPGVEKNARAVLDFESANYNARVFLALALFNLDQPEEAEETYKKAIEQSPSQALARQGLASFYEKKQRWTDYARELQGLMQLFAERQDAPKYAESLEKLLDVRRKYGTKDELIETLHYFLPSSPSHALLHALPAYDPTAPTATGYPTVQRFASSPLPVLLELISLISAIETAAVDAEIKKRRQRLGGPALTAEETTRQVQAEYLPQSQLPGLWRQVLDDPDAGNDEPLRRDIERRLLAHLCTTLRALPSPFDAPVVDLSAKAKAKSVEDAQKEQDAKDYYRREVEGLARGMVVIAVPEPAAWEVAIEWSDLFADGEKVELWPKERWDLLRRQAELFPDSGLAKLATATSQRVAAAAAAAAATAVPADDEEPAELPAAPSDDGMADIVENALAQSPRSLVTHLLATAFFAQQKEWDALLQVSEAGLAVLKGLEAEIGQGLPRSRRTLDTHLALSLVYNAPPTHHLRALRLLEHLLATPPPPPSSPALPPRPHPDPSLLIAKAHVLQSSEGKQAAALKVWDAVLALPAGALPPDALTQAKGERAWALHLAGQSDEARTQLEEVVAALEERKKGRDKEREEKEKWRSKRGVEKPEGVEEGEQPEEAEERAKAWWRMGECLWKLSESDLEQTQPAYNAYIAALRASPAFAPAFTSLGIYYRSLSTPDWERSSKCFQKAFELDPSQEVAARFLAEEFADLGEWSLVEVIARRVVEGNKGRAGMGGKAAARLAWAWKAIGASELNSKKFPQAVTAFQAALRGAPEDVSTWIKLGVAYRHSGKHIAALKVFVKALALDPDSWFAKYSVADVQREVGLLEPALKTFREILVDRPDELGVKVVLAETALTKGLDEQRAGFMVRAEESLVEALHESTAIVEGGTATRVAWKAAADALVGLSKVPQPELQEQSSALMTRLLDHLAEQDVDSKIAGMSVVTVAAVQQAVGEAPSSSVAVALSVLAAKMRVLLETQNEAATGSAWYDLGVAISNFRSRLSTLPSWPVPSDQALQQAIRCLKYALHKEPLNSTFWNALGVLSFDLSPRLAQHCFIRAIEHNARTAIPWTNLGLFYLVHGDEDLANQAFLKAQVLDSDWAAAWVGQATLADLAGHAVEASVLLEHAVSLGGQAPEADIAYASRAFEKYRASVPSSSTAEAIPGAAPPSAVEVLSAPLFALTRYLAQKPEDHTALHLNALILEQVGDLTSACESLEKAAALLEELYEVDESPAVEGQYVIAQTNLGRVRLAAENHQGALEAFEAALSLLSLDAPEVPGGLTREQSVILLTECKLGSSLAHVWLDDPDSAKQVLEGGLEDLEAHQVGACATHLGDALARVYWAEQDEDRALAALLDSPTMPQGKQTPLFHRRLFYAHAIATNDDALLQTTRQYTWNPAVKYDPELSRLSTLHHLSKHDAVGALSTVSRTLHAMPWAPAARSRIAHLLCTLEPLEDPSNVDDPLAPLLANIETAGRLMRLRVPGAEDSLLRSRRARTRGVVELQRAAEAEDEGAARARDEQALRFFERSMWIAPWEKLARDKFELAKAALAAE
ncbi:Superkiller protein 3 [Rhodotorula kratochvilovae]